jgi:hypothetical protein
VEIAISPTKNIIISLSNFKKLILIVIILVVRSWLNYIFILVTMGKKSPYQQQETNNIKMSSCIFGKLLSTYIRWMFLKTGDHS